MKFRSRALSSWVLLLGAAAPMPSAEQTKGPDALIQASTQAAHAHVLLEQCSYAEAEEWLQRALETARGSRSADFVERDTAGSLVARLQIQLAELRKRRKQLDREARELSRLVSAGWLETAQRRLVRLDPPRCDERFEPLADAICSRVAEAQSLADRGDRYLNRNDAGTALDLYRRARSLNREHPGLDSRIAEARGLRRSQRRIGAKIWKAVLYTAIAAGIGYAGYVGYRTYKERPEAPPPARKPATALRSPN